MIQKPEIKLINEVHHEKPVVGLLFGFNQELNSRVKTLEGAAWSHSRRFWYIPAEQFNLAKVFEVLKPMAFLDYSELKRPAHEKKAASKVKPDKSKLDLPASTFNQVESFKLWMKQARYSPNTIKTYADAIITFLSSYSDQDPAALTNEHLIEFNKTYIIQRNYSPSYQNQVINAVKLFYSRELKCSMDIKEIERPRKSKPLPKVLDKATIQKMLTGIPNLKHKTALTLIYGLGLRRSEMINMQLNDVDFERKAVMIRNGKGGKDRILPLSDKLIKLIKQQLAADNPQQYVIEGQYKGSPSSPTSLEKIFDKYLQKVAGKTIFTLHSLRHSFATHLLEAGVDLQYIQELPGYKSSKTTEIYTHVSMKSLSNIKNPTDDFDI